MSDSDEDGPSEEEQVADALAECSTQQREWWVIQFEDGSFLGEVVGDSGFDLHLFATEEDAVCHAEIVMDDVPVFFRAIEITLPEADA